MPYEYFQSSVNPRLLILLTDELEESVRVVNKIIDQQIQINFDGNAPKNRWFISVIGYNKSVKELISGWLRELDERPLRIESYKREISDGTGNVVEIECQQPLWVDCSNGQTTFDLYAKSIKLAADLCKAWADDYIMSPIVIDCSTVCYARTAKDEIDTLRRICTEDGPVLFWGCYPNIDDLFSKMPEEWGYKFKIWDLKEEDYRTGLLNYEHIGSIFSAMMYE